MVNTTVCKLCGNPSSDFIFSVKQYDVLACKECGLFYINPYPEESSAHSKVKEYSYNDLDIADAKTNYQASSMLLERYFERIWDECRNATSLLDVGCGTGNLLELIHKHSNLRCVGIELNSNRAQYARRVANCDIYQIPIEDFKSESKFDVITIINVLSHIPSFDHLFLSLHSLLAPQGKLIIKVGEMTNSVNKKAIFDWGIPDHLHFLGLNTIQFLAKKYNFSVIRHERVPLSQELFSKSRWRAEGRSMARNIVKKVILRIPFALQVLASTYDLIYGKEVFSSFIVMSPRDSTPQLFEACISNSSENKKEYRKY